MHQHQPQCTPAWPAALPPYCCSAVCTPVTNVAWWQQPRLQQQINAAYAHLHTLKQPAEAHVWRSIEKTVAVQPQRSAHCHAWVFQHCTRYYMQLRTELGAAVMFRFRTPVSKRGWTADWLIVRLSIEILHRCCLASVCSGSQFPRDIGSVSPARAFNEPLLLH
jgi:hypothetical protein